MIAALTQAHSLTGRRRISNARAVALAAWPEK
jgi:hypothetical protein